MTSPCIAYSSLLIDIVANAFERDAIRNPLLQWSIMEFTDTINQIKGGRITNTAPNMIESGVYLYETKMTATCETSNVVYNVQYTKSSTQRVRVTEPSPNI